MIQKLFKIKTAYCSFGLLNTIDKIVDITAAFVENFRFKYSVKEKNLKGVDFKLKLFRCSAIWSRLMSQIQRAQSLN